MRAALYTRVSRAEQATDGFSLDAQIKALREYCVKNGIEIYNEYTDAGITGQKEERPAFQEMIAAAENFDIILVHKFDRFARKIELSHRIKAILKKSNCNVISITEPVEDSPIGFFQEGLFELLAEYYVRNLAKEIKKGQTERASQGLHNGSVAFGYKAVDGKLYVCEEEAKIVRLIFDMHDQGNGCVNIARYLQSNRILTRAGRHFEYSQIVKMLHNVKYIGKIIYDGKIYQGVHEPIISDEQFERVNRNMVINDKGKNGIRCRGTQRSKNYYKFHLIDVLFCGECNSPMRIIYHNQKGWSAHSYKCSSSMSYRNNSCTHTRCYLAKKLEPDIEEMFKLYIKNNIDIPYTVAEKQNDSIDEILQNRINKVKLELKRAKEAYLAGVFDLAEFKESKDKLEAELKELEADIKKTKKTILKDKIVRSNFKSVIPAYLAEQDVCKKRELLLNVVEKVYLYADNSLVLSVSPKLCH